MFGGNEVMSPADIAAVTGGDKDGWGGNGAMWLVIFVLFFAFGGGGFGGGWGNRGNMLNSDNNAIQAAMQRGLDNNMVIGKLDRLGDGLCSLGYDQLGRFNSLGMDIANGFRGVDNAVCQLGYQTQQGFNQAIMTNMQGQNAIQSQLASRCCGIERSIDASRYEAAKNTGEIIQANERGIQRILDRMCAAETQQLRDENIRNFISAQMCGVVRYPQQTTYTAGYSPCFNGGGYGYGGCGSCA